MMTDANLVSFFGPSTPFWAAAMLAIVSLACSLLIFREPLPVEIGSVAAQLEGTEFVIISIFAGIYYHYKQKQKLVRGIKKPFHQ